MLCESDRASSQRPSDDGGFCGFVVIVFESETKRRYRSVSELIFDATSLKMPTLNSILQIRQTSAGKLRYTAQVTYATDAVVSC